MKKFYTKVAVEKIDETEEWGVMLDGKTLKTPAKNILKMKNQKLAEVVGEEWKAQKDEIEPMSMPLTRLINTAYDGVATDTQVVKEEIVRYGSCDMLCYRATGPENLVEQQKKLWDPWIDYAQNNLGCVLEVGEGIRHIEQDGRAMTALNTHVGGIEDPLLLSAVHVVTTLTGSAVLALAVYNDVMTCNEAWEISHLDENYNRQEWGEDTEASKRREKLFGDMKIACFVIETLRGNQEKL